jgi:hypothetical protein
MFGGWREQPAWLARGIVSAVQRRSGGSLLPAAVGAAEPTSTDDASSPPAHRLARPVRPNSERRRATIAVVPFVGRAGRGGEIDRIRLSRMECDQLVDVEL